MPRRIIGATLLCAFALASCRTWTPLEGVPQPLPEQVRVELLSGEQVKIRGGRLEADTLVGRRLGGIERVRVPIDQIASIEAGRVSELRTALAVIGGGLLVLSVVAIASFSVDLGG